MMKRWQFQSKKERRKKAMFNPAPRNSFEIRLRFLFQHLEILSRTRWNLAQYGKRCDHLWRAIKSHMHVHPVSRQDQSTRGVVPVLRRMARSTHTPCAGPNDSVCLCTARGRPVSERAPHQSSRTGRTRSGDRDMPSLMLLHAHSVLLRDQHSQFRNQAHYCLHGLIYI